MTPFIQITFADGDTGYIATTKIIAVNKMSTYTAIWFGSDDDAFFRVKNSPEEILAFIAAAEIHNAMQMRDLYKERS